MNVIWLITLLSLITLCLTASQESVELVKFHDSPSENGYPVAVQVENGYLKNISLSVLMAESWVRTHVLAFYPATNLSIIMVSQSILCEKNPENEMGLILPAMKNIHYSLTRWGLQNVVKVSVSFDSICFDPKSENYIKPLLNTLQEIRSPYIMISDENSPNMIQSHFKSMKNLEIIDLNKINLVNIGSLKKQNTFSSRRLLEIDFDSVIDPFPPRPTPSRDSPEPSPSFLPHLAPMVAPFGPHWTPPRNSLPPLIGSVSPEPSPSFSPHLVPTVAPFGPHLPPCNPSEDRGVGAPAPRVHNGVWCVAKPSVPPETLKEALNYACGEGGADCEAIKPNGNCYLPDSVVAHASYAFNSYWQKSKSNGGTCGFGGTAMLITSDPSYRHCWFMLV